MRSVNFIYSNEEDLKSVISANGFSSEKEYFIRVHTCVHTKDNIMPLVETILVYLPNAKIIGCSTSGVVFNGEIRNNCCMISITDFKYAVVKTELIRFTDAVDADIRGSLLADRTVGSIVNENSKYMFAFFARPFLKVSSFVERINELDKKIKLIGGIANTPIKPFINLEMHSFVFDNSGVSANSLAVAVVDTEKLSVYSDMMYVTEPVGMIHTITDADGMIIRTIDGENAVEWYEKQLGISFKDEDNHEMTALFPLVKLDFDGLPWALSYSPQNEKESIFPDEPEPVIFVPSEARVGDKVRIAYSSVQKNIEVCEKVCKNISEHSAEALFGYICVSHETLFHNCASWEAAPFENTNLSGCFVMGEIGNMQDKNIYCNYSFAVSALSEDTRKIRINTKYLRENSAELINNHENIIKYLRKYSNKDGNEALVRRQQEIEDTLFIDDETGLDNVTKYSYDFSIGKFDKICMITFRNEGLLNAFLSKSKFRSCLIRFQKSIMDFISNSDYNCYIYKKTSFIITASQYVCDGEFIDLMCSVQNFVADFRFNSYIPVTEFSVVMHEDDMINKAELTLVSMRSKNIFFLHYTSDLGLEQIHARKMKMLMILNDAIANDRVVPFFQGIRHMRTLKRI